MKNRKNKTGDRTKKEVVLSATSASLRRADLRQEPPEAPVGGIECQACGCRHFYVIYTRAGLPGQIVRRRECRHCGRRLTTIEKEND